MRWFFLVLVFFGFNCSAYTCHDEYIISSDRIIELLPDVPFQVIEDSRNLYVTRGAFKLIFEYLEDFDNDGESAHRYFASVLNEKYFFEIIETKQLSVKKWRQYSSGTNRRGYGGTCNL